MKTLFSSKTLIALAVAVAAAAAYESEANEQPIPPPATDSVLPDGIQAESPVAQVVRLVQAGVDVSVIQAFISHCPSGFNLDAEKIIILSDAGLSGELINAMFAHDKALLASISTTAPAMPAAPPEENPAETEPALTGAPIAEAPPQEVTVNYFYDTLTPYGSWVMVEGYGRCWRPNIVVYNPTWRPYCDRGRWVYTDCGWYWNSDYSWGATFHYGRWFNSPRYGWCWWPDTVWAPSWVTWRSGNDYCGWAPLPPFTVYQPGIGFSYCGNNVAAGFDFGLGANSFTFVSYGNFCQPHPRRYCVPQQQVSQFYSQTTVINDFNFNNHHRIRNNGISTTVIGDATRHPVQTVPVSSMAHARRHGWSGGNSPARNVVADANNGAASRNVSNPGLHHRPVVQNSNRQNDSRPNASGAAFRHPVSSSLNQPVTRAGQPQAAGRTPASPMTVRRPQQNQNPPPVRDLILTGHREQSAASTMNTRPVTSPAPGRSQARNPLTASVAENRQVHQPARTFTPPLAVERSQAVLPVRTPAPVQVASAPAASRERPQISRGESRQNLTLSKPTKRSAAPSAPAPAPGQPQSSGPGGYGRGQGWMAQNH